MDMSRTGLFGPGQNHDENLLNLFQNEEDNVPLEGSSGILTFMRMLNRSGQVNGTSSGEESDEVDDGEYESPTAMRALPPKQTCEPDLQAIIKNDIYLRVSYEPSNKNELPRLLLNRELAIKRSSYVGFDKKKKSQISSHFLPNQVKKICYLGHKGFCGTYSNDGSIFLAAAQDKVIRIFDTSKGAFREIKSISARDVGWSILDTAFSPDAQYVAYSSWSDSIHICRINGDSERDHESLPMLPDDPRRFGIFSFVFSSDGNDILCGTKDGYLYIYNRCRNQRVLKISAHDEDVNAVAYADETSKILFSVADDGLVKVWDRRCLSETTPEPVGLFTGHVSGITFVDTYGDGRYLITNSKDQSIKLWDLRSFSPESTVTACREAVDSNRWDYRWQAIHPKLCKVREPIQGDTSVMTYRGHTVLSTLIRCRFSPQNSTNQRFIYTGCAAGRILIYDILTGQVVRCLSGHDGVVRDVSWHPDNMEIVSTSWDGSIGHWTFESHVDAVNSVT